MATIYRIQVQLAPYPGYEGNVLVGWWATLPGTGTSSVTTQLGAKGVAGVATQSFAVADGSASAAQRLTDCAALRFRDAAGGNPTSVILPAPESAYLGDGETVDDGSAWVIGVRGALVSAGLCTPDGTPLVVADGGQRTQLQPAPWPANV